MKIKNRLKYLFTKEVFGGENSRVEFFLYNLLIGIFIVPANTYLNLENGSNSILIVLSLISFLFGLYLMIINTIRRGNKTKYPIMGIIAVVALIAGQTVSDPSLYSLSAIILLLLPNKKVSSIEKKIGSDALTYIKKGVLEDNTKDKS